MSDYLTRAKIMELVGLTITRQAFDKRAAKENFIMRKNAHGANEYLTQSLPNDWRVVISSHGNSPTSTIVPPCNGLVPAINGDDYAVSPSRAETGGDQPLPPVLAINDPHKKICINDRALNTARAKSDILLYFKTRNLSLRQFVQIYNETQIAELSYAQTHIAKISVASLVNWQQSDADNKPLIAQYGNRAGCGIIDKTAGLAEYLIEFHIQNTRVQTEDVAVIINEKFNVQISPSSINRYIHNYKNKNKSVFLARQNPGKWRSTYKSAIGELYSWATAPNDLWLMDATPSDTHCIDGRKTIYALIDVATRRIIAHVGESAATRESLALLRRAITEWGAPKNLITDNGSDFISKWFQITTYILGIKHTTCAPYSPEKKGHIERGIGVINSKFMPLFGGAGYLGHNVKTKSEIIEQRNFSETHGQHKALTINISLTMAELGDKLTRWLNHKYHHRAHSGLGNLSPNEKLAMTQYEKRVIAPEVLGVLFAPMAKNPSRLITNRGVVLTINNKQLQFFQPTREFAELIGRRVNVHFDESDMGTIHLWSDDYTQYLGVAYNTELHGESLTEWSAKSAAWQKEQFNLINKQHKSARDAVRKTSAIDIVLAHHESTNRQDGADIIRIPTMDNSYNAIETALNLKPVNKNHDHKTDETSAKMSDLDVFKYAKFLEHQISTGGIIDESAFYNTNWLKSYQKSAKYLAFNDECEMGNIIVNITMEQNHAQPKFQIINGGLS